MKRPLLVLIVLFLISLAQATLVENTTSETNDISPTIDTITNEWYANNETLATNDTFQYIGDWQKKVDVMVNPNGKYAKFYEQKFVNISSLVNETEIFTAYWEDGYPCWNLTYDCKPGYCCGIL